MENFLPHSAPTVTKPGGIIGGLKDVVHDLTGGSSDQVDQNKGPRAGKAADAGGAPISKTRPKTSDVDSIATPLEQRASEGDRNAVQAARERVDRTEHGVTEGERAPKDLKTTEAAEDAAKAADEAAEKVADPAARAKDSALGAREVCCRVMAFPG